LEGVLLGSEPSEPEGSDSNEERESQGGGRSPSRGRCHQHQVGHGGGEGDLESGLGLAEVFRLPNPELNQAADPVLDRDSPAVALSESLRPLLLAQTPERFRLLGDLQDARCGTTLRALCA
jgi:hypothetical protein